MLTCPCMRKAGLPALVFCVAAVAAGPGWGDEATKATVTFLKQGVRVQPAGSTAFIDVGLGREFAEGDTVFVLGHGRAELRLETGQIVRVGPNSKFILRKLRKDGEGRLHALIEVVAGRVWFTLVRMVAGSDLELQTPSVTVGVRGTVWRADVDPQGRADVYVYDGAVTARPVGGAESTVKRLEHLAAGPSAAARTERFDEAQDERDEWVRWNRNRDRLRVSIVIRETLDGKPLTAAAAETAMIRGFLDRYLFKIIDKEQSDRIRAAEAVKAGAKGDPAAIAAAGLSVAADLVIVGEANVSSLKTPLPGNPISARVSFAGRAVRTDTAEVVAAWAPELASRALELTEEAAAHKALVIAGGRAATAFMDEILAAWKEAGRRGEVLDVTVDGVDYAGLKRITDGLSGLSGVRGVQRLYLVGRKALLGVTFTGDTVALADEIQAVPGIGVTVVGLTAYRIELEADTGK